MTVTRNSAVGDSAVDLLFEQFKGKANFAALCRCFVAPDSAVVAIQELENILADVLSLFPLATARGDQLKRWGAIVGCPPAYATDDLYRDAIYLQIAINTSLGLSEQLIDVTKRITHGSFVHYIQKQPAVALLYAHMLAAWAETGRVEEAATGGVQVVVTGSPVDDVFVFGPDCDAAGTEHPCADELTYGSGLGET